MRVSDSSPVLDFVAVAERYCALIERGPSLSAGELLTVAEALLLQLYSAALALPDLEAAEEDWRTDAVPHEAWAALHHGLRRALGPCDLYREIYDSAALGDPAGAIEGGDEPVVASLADDLADIWRELKRGLQVWATAAEAVRYQVVFEWRASFGWHWGQHLADALRAVHWWRHVHHVGQADAPPEP